MSSISKIQTVASVEENGLYLGRSPSGDVTSGAQRSTLVLGPSRSGKTTSLILPNLLMTERSAIVTSTKDDVVQAMAHARSDATVLLFDPSGSVPAPPGVRRVGYSPLRQAQEWDGAVLATRTLLDVQALARGNRGEDHWSERAGALVAPLLHASALRRENLPQVLSRIDARKANDSLDILGERYGQHHPATSLLTGILATEERERSGIWSSASSLFAGLRTEAARQSSREAPLQLEKFFSAPHQLHVVSPSRHQAVSTPLVVGMIDEIVNATYDRHQKGARLLLALDELANVAPLPRLTSIISEGGGQGVVTMACLQDLSQARARWGTAAEGFLSLFPTTVVLPGIADRPTLELLQQLAGRDYVATPSVQHSRRGRAVGHTMSWSEHDKISIAQLAQGREGYALALDSRKRLGWVALTPSYRDPRFRPYLEREARSSERSLER
jgi:type IV secretory pathway TraG/TraD family ATPase VirD4